MTDKYILDANDQPVPCDDLEAWSSWYETSRDRRRVALDDVGKVRVSTVFLSLDHSFGQGAPVLYETMVFGGPLDDEQQRYHTRDEAVAGHALMLAKVRVASRVEPALELTNERSE